MKSDLFVLFNIPGLFKDDSVYPGYRPPLFTVWHKDPRKDGIYDSCGICSIPISQGVKFELKGLTAENHDYCFNPKFGGWDQTPFEITYNIWSVIAFRFFNVRKLTPRDLVEIIRLSTNSTDNLRMYLKTAKTDTYNWDRAWLCIYTQQVKFRTPWYKKPLFHIHHWRVQWHFGQDVRRWVFHRCATCGGRFQWRYTPMADDTGRSHHNECLHRETHYQSYSTANFNIGDDS